MEDCKYMPVYTNTKFYLEQWHKHVFKSELSDYQFISYSQLIGMGVDIHRQISDATSASEIVRLYKEDDFIRQEMRRFEHDFHVYMEMRGFPVFNSIEDTREYSIV